MLRYLTARLVWTAGILFGLSLLFFALEQFTPYGPCGAFHQPYDPSAAPRLAACMHQFAVGQALPVQYVHVMAHYLRGDTGPSISTQSLGTTLSLSRPQDVLLLLGAILVQIPLAASLGSAAARWPRSWFSRSFTPVAVVGRWVPPFWLAVMLLFVPALQPGAVRPFGPFPPFWSHAWFVALAHHPGSILGGTVPPLLQAIIVVVAAGTLASSLVVRDAVSTELHEAQVIAARSGGLSRGAIFRRALRTSLSTAMIGLSGRFGAMLGAMAVAGYILYSHLGSPSAIFVQATQTANPAVAQGLFMVVALVALGGGLLSGVLQGVLDPRVRDSSLWTSSERHLATAGLTRARAGHLRLLAGLALFGLLTCLAMLAPLISPESFSGYDYSRTLVPPHLAWPWRHEWRYVFGSDGTGHAMLMWVVYGARIPLAVGLLAALIAACLGVLLGSLRALPGSLGAWGDLAARWIAAVVTTPPLILLVFMLTLYLAHGQWIVIALILGLVGWPGIARVARSPEVRQRQAQVTMAGRAIGMSGPRLWWRGFRPLAGPLLNATFRFAALAIALDAAMDFLGVGVSPSITPTWGNAFVLNPSYLGPGPQGGPAWWVPFFPGLCILLASVSFAGIGEGLQRLLDSPRATRRTVRVWVFRRSRAQMDGEVTAPAAAGQDSFSVLSAPIQEGRGG